MRRLIFLPLLLLAGAAFGQQQPWVPIVLDQQRFNAFAAELDEIAIPARSYRRIVELLQRMETQARIEKAQADAKAAEAREGDKGAAPK